MVWAMKQSPLMLRTEGVSEEQTKVQCCEVGPTE